MYWLARHPCDANVKSEAAKEGCRVIDIRFRDHIPSDQIAKVLDGKTEGKAKRKRKSKED